MEHLHHFGLRQDPFQNEPDLRFYFDSGSHAEPQRRVERGLRQFKGLSVLTGEAGTGKTLLSRRLLEALEEELFDAHLMVMLPGASDACSVLSRYARMLGVEEAATDRPALLAQVYEKLAIVREDGRHSVLILDDAHLLDRDAMAEMGGVLNLEYEDRRLLSLLIVGLPQVDVVLGHEPSMGQRVDVRAQLKPLDHRNTMAYLLHRISTVGGDATILAEDSIQMLFKYGRGRPRLLNTLADNALFEAYLGGRQQILGEDVERAAQDLGIGLEPGSTYTDMAGRGDPADSAAAMEGAGPGASASDISGPSISTESMLAEIGPPGPELDAPSMSGHMSHDLLEDMSDLDAHEVSPGAHDAMDAQSDVDPRGPTVDLGELLDDPEHQPTELMGMPRGPAAGSAADPMPGGHPEISSTAQAVLEQVDIELGSPLPSFEGHNRGAPGGAEATRVAFPEEEQKIAMANAASQSDEDFDDLFVELIEE